MNWIVEVFQSNPHLSLAGFIVRSLVSAVTIYLMSRFLMKRAAGQFTTFDFTFLWMLGALSVAPILDGRVLLSDTVVALVTVYSWHYIVSWLAVKNRMFANLVRGKPIVLLEKGKLRPDNMRRGYFSIDLLAAEMRLSDAPNFTEVEQVILETSGHLSVVKKSEYVPPLPADFQIALPQGGLPTILINDGRVIEENLHSLGLRMEWLENRLLQYGIKQIENVYLATLSSDGTFYYSVKK